MIRFWKYVVILIFLVRVVADVCSQTLFLNFDSLNNLLVLYKQKGKTQEIFY